MKKAHVFFNERLAGELERNDLGEYVFRYDEFYRKDAETRPIALSFPKSQREFRSSVLFPFFFNMLSEGANRQLQCRCLKIDERDHFSLLLATAQVDTIGAVTVKPIHYP